MIMRTLPLFLIPLLTLSSHAIAENTVSRTEIAVFDCARLTWMQDCDEVNRQARENPDKPLRTFNANGLEYNFAPGTPAVMMRHLIAPSPDTARQVADHLEGHLAMNSLAADYWRDEVARRGGALKGTRSLAQIEEDRRNTHIDTENVRVFLFYDSRQAETRSQFNELRKLVNRYPDLRVSLIQLDKDQKNLEELNKAYSANATILSGVRRDEILRQITVTPTVWAQNVKTNNTEVLIGYSSIRKIITSVSKVSK